MKPRLRGAVLQDILFSRREGRVKRPSRIAMPFRTRTFIQDSSQHNRLRPGKAGGLARQTGFQAMFHRLEFCLI
jgi:hypothetical protein